MPRGIVLLVFDARLPCFPALPLHRPILRLSLQLPLLIAKVFVSFFPVAHPGRG